MVKTLLFNICILHAILYIINNFESYFIFFLIALLNLLV